MDTREYSIPVAFIDWFDNYQTNYYLEYLLLKTENPQAAT
jgi:hypothetical protein